MEQLQRRKSNKNKEQYSEKSVKKKEKKKGKRISTIGQVITERTQENT